METVTYAERCYVHPDRYGVKKTHPNRLAVLHTSEGREGEASAEGLCSYMGSPGDRTTSSGTRYGSSYAYVADTDDMIPAVPEDTVSYSAAGANNDGIHYCFPGTARQTRDEWLDPISRAYIRNVALGLIDLNKRTGIPLRKLTVAEVQAGKWGLCDHYTITLAYGRTDHTDVGANFPWDVLFADIAKYTADKPDPDPEEDPMICWKDERFHDTFQVSPAVSYVDGATVEAGGATVLVGRHLRMLKSLAAQCEIDTVSANGTSSGPWTSPGNWVDVAVDSIPDKPA